METPEKYHIPTRAEHSREVRRLWITCAIMAALVLLGAAGGVFALLVQGHPWSKVANIFAVSFGIIILAYGISVFIPSLFTSLKRMGLSMDLGRRGLEVGQATAELLLEMKKEIKPIADGAKKTTEGLDRLVERLDKNLSEDFFKRIDDALDGLAFSKEPLPMPPPRLTALPINNGKGEKDAQSRTTE